MDPLYDFLAWLKSNLNEINVGLFTTVVGVLCGYFLSAGKMTWQTVKSLFGDDEYKPLYGSWYSYRLNKLPKNGFEVFETTVEIERRILRPYPKCVLRTRYMSGGQEITEVSGWCKIVGNKLVLCFENSTSKTNPFFGPATSWFMHQGRPEFRDIKIGKQTSVAATGDIVCGDQLLTRGRLQLKTVSEYIDFFDRLTMKDAVDLVKRIHAELLESSDDSKASEKTNG